MFSSIRLQLCIHDSDDEDTEEDGDTDHGFFGTDESAFLDRFSHGHVWDVVCALTADFEGKC